MPGLQPPEPCIGSAVVGLGGAMLVTLGGQFTPGAYNPMRFTFLVWVMMILGGSGSNRGAILGGCLVWLFWVEAETLGNWFVATLSGFLGDGSPIRRSLVDNAAQMRLAVMGALLICVVRFAPAGLIPAKRKAP